MGLAVRSSVHEPYASFASGTRQAAHTPTLSATRTRRDTTLVERLQIHPRVERRDLVRVAVEHERLAPAELADAPLGGLAPARVVDGGVHVGVEAVLLRRRLVPGRLRLLLGETDAHDRLRALEAVLPRDDDAHGRAVLVGEHLAVHADRQQRERVHRLVEAQSLRVRPVEPAAETEEPGLLRGELLGVLEGRELDVLRLARGLGALEYHRQRVADPRDDHRPRLHAAQRVDALLERRGLEELVDVEALWLGHEPVDDDRPRPGTEGVAAPRGIALVGAELVEVVVGGRALVLGRRVLDAEFRIRRGLERPRLRRRRGGARAAGDDQGGGADHERAAVEIDRLRRDVRGVQPPPVPPTLRSLLREGATDGRLRLRVFALADVAVANGGPPLVPNQRRRPP